MTNNIPKCLRAASIGVPIIQASMIILLFLFSGSSLNAQTCPTIGSIDVTETSCQDFSFSIAALNLLNYEAADNGEADFDINFVYLPAASAADPYVDGLVLATVTPDLGNAQVLDAGSDLPVGDYDIYAILNPAPADPGCRPFAMSMISITPCEDIGDFCFLDFDNNGVFDGYDVPLPSVVVSLYDATTDGLIYDVLPATSNQNGNYWFAPIAPGEFFLEFSPPAGYIAANSPLVLENNSNHLDPLAANGPMTTADFNFDALTADFTFDAAFVGPGSIGGKVWADDDFNGVDNEAGIISVSLALSWYGPNGIWDDGDDVLLPIMTDVNGEYSFPNLPYGDYRLNITSLNGTVLALGYDLVQPVTQSFEITIEAGNTDFSTSHFIYQPQCLPTSGILETPNTLILCGNDNLGIYADQEVEVYLDNYVTPLSVADDYEFWVFVVNELGEIVQSHYMPNPFNGNSAEVDITGMPTGDYSIHSLHYLTTDPELSMAFDFSNGASFQAITDRLTMHDGNPNVLLSADVCGDVSLAQGFVQLSMNPQPPVYLGCIGMINTSLNSQCAATITPQVVLTGTWGCLIPDDFQISIYDNGLLVSDEGLITGCGTYEYRVDVLVDGISGFPCWGIINARDNIAPSVSCPADISNAQNALGQSDFLCTDISQLLFQTPVAYTVNSDGSILDIDISIKTVLDVTGYPTVTDACGPSRIYISDVLQQNGDCGETTITRVFLTEDNAEDQCSTSPNLAPICSQIIHFTKPIIDDLVLPDITLELPCADFGGLPNPTPDQIYNALGVFGYPAIYAFFDADPETTEFDPFFLNQTYCNIGASYQDLPRINLCGSSYIFIREWYIIDDCNPSSTTVLQQNIKIKDVTDPELVLPVVDYDNDGFYDVRRYSTSPFDCLANITFPTPTTMTDFCSGPPILTVTVRDENGDFIFEGTLGGAFSVPIGSYTLEYCAVDDCDNQTCEIMPIIVRDDIAPSVICNNNLLVQIGGGDSEAGIQGIARVLSTSVDEGSNDNCSPVSLQVRRNFWENDDCSFSPNDFSPWGDFVDFYCCDVGKNIIVELKVTDEVGNENVCQLSVFPEDKLVPFCSPPSDQTVTCVEWPLLVQNDIETAYATDFDNTSILMTQLFGGPTGTDNCGVDTLIERSPLINLNSCGWGTIQRRFKAWQWDGDTNQNGQIDASESLESSNSCTQTITITEKHHYRILFPADTDADCSDPEIPGVETEIFACDQLVINVSEPQRFSTTGDECYKLSITYDIINWCLWDAESDAYIIPRMTDADNLDVDDCERPILETTDQGTTIDRNHNEPNCDSSLDNAFQVPAVEDIGRWSYTQFVKVYDNEIPTITAAAYGGSEQGTVGVCTDLEPRVFGSIDSEDCNATATIPFSLDDDCETFNSNDELVLEVTGAWVDFLTQDTNLNGEIESNEFTAEQDVLNAITYLGDTDFVFELEAPIIYAEQLNDTWHALLVEVRDACGNVTAIYLPFQIVDCKAPSPICLTGLSVTVQPALEGGCEATIWTSDLLASPIDDCSAPISYAIYASNDVGPDFIPNPIDTGLLIPWNDQEYIDVNVYAIDGQGNFDYCEANVQLQPGLACTALGALGGMIRTEDDLGVGNVQLNLSGPVPMVSMSEPDGSFLFDDLEEDLDYTITASRGDFPLNGVTTFDIVLISKHILAIQPLDSPYKLIAADVNRSGAITTLDIIHMRKLILNIYDEFPSNTSWRFVDMEYEFPVLENPWLEFFPELININDLVGEELELGFIAIKVGDVNGSATP